MANNTINWGQGAVNNDIGWGQGAVNNSINWGESQEISWAGDTEIFGSLPLPVNSIAPVISGLTLVGETLTTTNGTWSSGSTIAYTYQWQRNASNITGATSSTYILVSADLNNLVSCVVTATNNGGAVSASSNSLTISQADLINLQSYDASKFTLSGSNITAWTEQNGSTQWTRSASPYPTLNSGVPTFAGSGTALERSADVSATTYSLYAVTRLTGETTNNQSLFASKTGTNWVGLNQGYLSTLMIGGTSVSNNIGGYKGKRDVVFWIRRTGNTVAFGYNNTTCLQLTNLLAGQNTSIGRLMSISGFAAFSMVGTMKAFVTSSAALSDAAHSNLVNSLYNKYNLDSNTAADTIIGFGDSNTTGAVGATSYIFAVASSFGLGYKNLGIAGSLFTTFSAVSGYTRYPAQLILKPFTDKYVIQYGTNDVLGAVSVSTYETQFTAMVADMVAQGVNPNNICLCSIPYQLNGLNATKLNDFRTVIVNVATTYGTRYFDLLQAMRDGGGNTLLSDNVHLNNAGQTIWSNGVIAALS